MVLSFRSWRTYLQTLNSMLKVDPAEDRVMTGVRIKDMVAIAVVIQIGIVVAIPAQVQIVANKDTQIAANIDMLLGAKDQ